MRDILELLLEGGLVQLLANSELSVDALLRDVEVLHVEEPVLPDGLDERLRELLVPFRRSVQAEVKRNEIRPREVLLI